MSHWRPTAAAAQCHDSGLPEYDINVHDLETFSVPGGLDDDDLIPTMAMTPVMTTPRDFPQNGSEEASVYCEANDMFPAEYENPFRSALKTPSRASGGGEEDVEEPVVVEVDSGKEDDMERCSTSPSFMTPPPPFFDLTFAPPPAYKRDGTMLPSTNGFPMPITCYNVPEEPEACRLYWEETKGPFFSEPASPFLQETGLFGEKQCEGEGSPGGGVVVPLSEVVKHVVATVRVVDGEDKQKTIYIKDTKYKHVLAMQESGGMLVDQPVGKKRGRPRKESYSASCQQQQQTNVDDNNSSGSAPSVSLASQKRRKTSPSTFTTMSPGMDMGFACVRKTVRPRYTRQAFVAHRIMRQKTMPITVRYGDTSFLIPLPALVLGIAEKMCHFRSECTQPIAVDKYIPAYMHPLVNYTFPPFMLSAPVAEAVTAMIACDGAQKPATLTCSSSSSRERSSSSSPDSMTIDPQCMMHPSSHPFFLPDENYYGPVVRHVREVICDGDPVAYTALEMWLGELLFNPAAKYPVCPIISGPQGTGKNLFFDFLLKHIFGFDVTASVTGLDRVTGRFNAVLENKVLVLVNEEHLNKVDRTVEVLKTMCSEVIHCIERKYSEVKENVEVFARYAVLTNIPDPYKLIPMHERRFLVIRTTSRIPSGDYFEDLVLRLDDGRNAPITAMHYVGFLAELRKHRYPCEAPPRIGTSGQMCERCVIPHRFMHPLPNGYSPQVVLRKPIRTGYTGKKLAERISDLHLFLYAFVVRRLPMRTILPRSVTTDAFLSVQIPAHKDLGDLLHIDRKYFFTCYFFYLRYGSGSPFKRSVYGSGGPAASPRYRSMTPTSPYQNGVGFTTTTTDKADHDGINLSSLANINALNHDLTRLLKDFNDPVPELLHSQSPALIRSPALYTPQSPRIHGNNGVTPSSPYSSYAKSPSPFPSPRPHPRNALRTTPPPMKNRGISDLSNPCRALHDKGLGELPSGPKGCYYNLSGAQRALEAEYKDCYKYIKEIFDEVFSECIAESNGRVNAEEVSAIVGDQLDTSWSYDGY